MDSLKVPNTCGEAEVNGCDKSKCKKVTREQCLKIIRKHLKSDEFELLSYSESPLSDKPVGFLGEHIRLRASVLHNQQILDLRFFIKSIPTDCSSHTEYILNTGVFSKEATLYATLLRDLKRIQCTVKDPNPTGRKGSLTPCYEKITSWGPNSYFKTDEILVLEDLAVKGFSIVEVREPLDYDHVVVSLQTVAQFHAASIIFEEKRGSSGSSRKSLEDLPKSIKYEVQGEDKIKTKLNELFPDLLFETLFVETKGHPGNDFFESGIKCLTACIGLLKGYSKKDMEKIKKAFPGELRKAMDFVKPYQNYRNVLNHGDLWSNNILFRYEDDKVVDARLVDFQNCRYSPPAHDVMDLLHLTTTRKFREEHLEKFLSLYYEALRDELKKHSLDIDNLLPWDEFRESCDYFREIAVCTAVFWFQLITMPTSITTAIMSSPEALEQNFRVDRTELVTKAFKTDKPYRDRLGEALHEMIERYILKC